MSPEFPYGKSIVPQCRNKSLYRRVNTRQSWKNLAASVTVYQARQHSDPCLSGVHKGDVGMFVVRTLAALSGGSYLSFLGVLGDISSQ